MELNEYQRLAADTDDRVPHGMDGLRVLLLGVVGEAGSAASEAKKSYRDVENPDSQEEAPPWVAELICEELGDMLWYMAAVARRLGRDFDTIATDNLEKASELWRRDLPPPAGYDEGFPEEQSLLRRFTVLFDEDTTGLVPVVRMRPHDDRLRRRIVAFRERKKSPLADDQIGDTVDDNAHDDIGYRFHDVLHLAHAAVLGWSPVFRSLTGSKRKEDDDFDRVQDGARAIAIEEGVAAFVFNYAEERDFLFDAEQLDWTLVKHIRRTVRGLEVENAPAVAWGRAYAQAFDIFRRLRETGGGLVSADLDQRTLTFAPVVRKSD
jgi:NTP pyrophosphatase (non-canonical NTP hydrolase)